MTQMLALAAVAAALVVGGVTPALAGVPTETVRDYTDAVVRVLEDPTLQADDRRAERRAAVRKIAIDIFDIQETARRALGHHWQQRTPQEREEFVQLFADLLERTYISKIDLFGGERLKFTDEKVDGEHAVVRAKIISKEGTEVPVEARMLNRTGRWQIYDIVIENISLVGNYRSQFDRIIRSSSYAELAKRLRMQNAFLNENAGMNAQALFGEILANKGKAVDVNTGALVDPLKAGIIDPKRVTREAIQNAVSIAGTGMTMGALVVDVPEVKTAAAPDMSQMGM